jgi:outer membrane autotransporter protein
VPAFAGQRAGSFLVNGDLASSGVLNLASTSAPGNVLAVRGNYTGNGGRLVLSTRLTTGGPLSNQFTDRLLVSGTASGTTTVQVNATGGGGTITGDSPTATRGISLIQVGGSAAPGTFQLANGYVSGGSPFAYRLFAFGPGSPNGPADPGQNALADAPNTWDYRLENGTVTNGNTTRPQVLPQVPSYLTTPTALFNAGFQNLDSLHRRLGEIRDDQLQNRNQQGEVFVRAFGQRFDYASTRSFADYGINSQQAYAATQFGANGIAVNDADGTLRLGLAGTLGRLWFQPSAPDGESKGTFNMETIAGTVTWQSTDGWYVDGIVAGGLFDGVFTTAARGRTTGMNGTTVATSVEGGYPVAFGDAFAIEPQIQFVYQHLDFAHRTDIDGVGIDFGSPDQGMMRAGARLLRHMQTDDGVLITPYVKANLLQGIGGGSKVQLSGVGFGTGAYGTAMQVGGGATGTLTRNLSIYGDVAWQHQVSDGGFRGWAFNGGLRYAFGEPPPTLPGPPVAAPVAAAARTYLVFFDWDRADLTDHARQIIAQAAANSHEVELTRIVVNGYTDTSGTHHYNLGLSVRRARSVAAELVRDGVEKELIETHGYGDTHLVVPTGPGVRNPQNRRVEIIFK